MLKPLYYYGYDYITHMQKKSHTTMYACVPTILVLLELYVIVLSIQRFSLLYNINSQTCKLHGNVGKAGAEVMEQIIA